MGFITLLIFLGILSAHIPIQARWSTVEIARFLGSAAIGAIIFRKLPEQKPFAPPEERGPYPYLSLSTAITVLQIAKACFIKFIPPGKKGICDDLYGGALFSFVLFFMINRMIKPLASEYLIVYAHEGNLDGVKRACRLGANVDVIDRHGDTALMIAAIGGHLDVIQYLVKKDANLNAIGENGYSTLMYATMNGHSNVIQYLVKKKGANFLNAQNNNGTTALAFAALGGKSDIVKYLYEHEADPFIETVNGTNPFFAYIADFLRSDASRDRKNPLRRETKRIIGEKTELLTPIILDAYDKGIKPAIRSTLVGEEDRGKYRLLPVLAQIIADYTPVDTRSRLTPEDLEEEQNTD